MVKYKLNKYFEFPFNLDMKEFLYEDNKTKELNTEYELRGITIHFGVADFGHYYDLIKGPDNKWYKFNDISVTQFKEEDIAKEAFGEKEIFEEDSSKEKENGKNNAYILIYKKTNFNQNSIDKYKENELAIPPYNKYSNINDDLKKEINFKLYKSWTMKNIASPVYQNFVISLIKFDIAKIKEPKVEKSFITLLYKLKEEKISKLKNEQKKVYDDLCHKIPEICDNSKKIMEKNNKKVVDRLYNSKKELPISNTQDTLISATTRLSKDKQKYLFNLYNDAQKSKEKNNVKFDKRFDLSFSSEGIVFTLKHVFINNTSIIK